MSISPYRFKSIECVAERPQLWILTLSCNLNYKKEGTPDEVRMVISRSEAEKIAATLNNSEHQPPSLASVMKKALAYYHGEVASVYVENKYDNWRIAEISINNTDQNDYAITFKIDIIDALTMITPIGEFQYLMISNDVIKIMESEYETLVGVRDLAVYDISRLPSESDSVLQMMLERAIEAELYELASKIRDELTKRKA